MILAERYGRAVTWDDLSAIDPVLLALGVALIIGAGYFLLLRRDSVMLGFLCIVGVVVIAIIAVYPEFNSTR